MFSSKSIMTTKLFIDANFDIGIVGCGLSGMLIAWKLVSLIPDIKICMFEKNFTIGGSISSRNENNYELNFGNNNFDWCWWCKNFLTISPILNIELQQFYPVPVEYTIDFYQLNEHEQKECFDNDVNTCFINLLKYALKSILQSQWNDGLILYDKYKLDLIRKFAMYNNIPLWQQNIKNVLAQTLSPYACDFIIANVPPFLHINDDSNASEYICYFIEIINTFQFLHVKPKNGCYDIISKLYEKIKDNVCFLTNHYIHSISEQDNLYRLSVLSNGSKTIYVNRVIFTTDTESLSKIEGLNKVIENITRDLSIHPIYELYVLCKYDKNVKVSRFYTKLLSSHVEISTISDKNNDFNLISIIGNENTLSYWKGNLKTLLIELFHKAFPTWNNPTILKVVMNSSKDIKSGYGYDVKQNCQSHKVYEYLSEFKLTEDGGNNVHICGKQFSSELLSIERSFDSIDRVVKKILPKYDQERKTKSLDIPIHL
jgi:hypothetical protein